MKRTLITIALLALAACRPAAAETPAPAEPAVQQAIVIGEITDDPAEVILGAQPLADYLAERLADYGVTGGEVRVVQTPEEMADLLASGEVDIFFDSVFPATVIADQSGAQIVLRRWKFGVEAYQSVIFARADSGITRLEDLPGHILVMDTPYSTSGFLMPAVTLTSLGLPLVGKDSANAAVAPDEIGFVFSFSDPATLNWVLTGIAPAGVTDDYNFDVALPEEAAGKLVELARTEKIPRQVMLASPTLNADLLDAIVQILLGMDADPAAAAALEAFLTTKFDEFPEGIDAAVAQMREWVDMTSGIPLP